MEEKQKELLQLLAHHEKKKTFLNANMAKA